MSMTQMEEFRVVQAVRNGDIDRFEELVRAYESPIYRLCRRMLGSEQDALDASQEAFFKAYKALDDFRGDSRFSTWLYRLATNVCLDMLRSRPAARELSSEDNDALLSRADPSPSPQESLEMAELRSSLEKALRSLEPDFRKVIVLRDVNGLSYEEIATIENLELGTVKSRIYRARRKLADALMSDGNFLELYPSKSTEERGKGGAGR